MDRLADELVRGERTFFAPPGVWSFIGTLITTAFGVGVLLIATAPIVAGTAGTDKQPWTELLAVQLAWIIPCVLGLMAAKGVAGASLVWRRTVDITLVAALIMLAVNFNDESLRTAFAISAVLLFAAFVLLRSVGFAIAIVFRQRVKARRQAFFAQHRAYAKH